MKHFNGRSIFTALVASIILFSVSAIQAADVTYENANMGDYKPDNLIASADLGNSGNEEVDFLVTEYNDYFGTLLEADDFLFTKYEDDDLDLLNLYTDGTTYAIDFEEEQGDFFILKFGEGNLLPDTNTTYLFENIDGLSNLVWLIGDLDESIRVTSLSHVVAAVPVPASVWLFGTSLLGIAGFRRFSKKQA